MMVAVNIIPDSFVGVDKIFDYIPFYSTGLNLIVLFQKCVILPFVSDLSIRTNAYLSHVDQKSFVRCVILLVPFLGNIVIALYDYSIVRSYKLEKEALQRLDLSYYNSEDRDYLSIWLDRLYDFPFNLLENTIEDKRRQLSNVLEYVRFAGENEGFRAQLIAIIEDAATSCYDRAALSVINVGIAYQIAKMGLRDPKTLADFIKRSDFSMKKLEKCARELILASPMIPGTNRERDEIEVYLAYPVMLKHKLNLPIDIERMKFFAFSGVTLNDLNTAYETVSQELANEEEFYLFLANHSKWNEALAFNYRDQYAAIQAARDAAVEAVENQTLEVVGGDPIDDFAQAERYHEIQRAYLASLVELTRGVLRN